MSGYVSGCKRQRVTGSFTGVMNLRRTMVPINRKRTACVFDEPVTVIDMTPVYPKKVALINKEVSDMKKELDTLREELDILKLENRKLKDTRLPMTTVPSYIG